ncbi:MAG: hypothetical protein ABI690_16015 [Chloroflexota bacterium]
MSKRIVTMLLALVTVSFLIANVTAKLSAAIPVSVVQTGATATPEPSRTPRPRPQASATLSDILVIIEHDTQLFAQPDNTSEILSPLPAEIGGLIRLLAVTRDQRWYQIQIGTTTGWVSSAAARIIGDRFGVYDYATQPPTPSPLAVTPTIAPIATERMVGSYPTVLIRNRREVFPGTSIYYPSIGVIMPGQTAEILAMASGQFDWYLVRYENGAGWTPGQLERDIQGDVSQLPHLSAPPEPTLDYSRIISQPPGDIVPFLASATPSPEVEIAPTQAGGPGRVADFIDILLEPKVPEGSFTPEQLTAASDTLRVRIGQYPITDYSVEVDTVANTLHVRFADNYYREEIISVVQQEGLFEAVNFTDQSVELRAALLHQTIMTSGYGKRQSQLIRQMTETYNITSSVDLAALGYIPSTRRPNILNDNKAFGTVFDDQSVTGASMVPGRHLWDVSLTLNEDAMENYQHYPLNSFIAFTLDGAILAIPLASDVVHSPFTLTLHYEENQARMLVVLLRSGSLPFAMRAKQITYVNNS